MASTLIIESLERHSSLLNLLVFNLICYYFYYCTVYSIMYVCMDIQWALKETVH